MKNPFKQYTWDDIEIIDENDTKKSLVHPPTSFDIKKADDEKRLVFGWALVSATSDGEKIIDHQGDIVEQEDLEEGAYEYVLNFRDAGEEHNAGLRKKARMVESVVFTSEKLKAMGIPEGTIPYGWWIGFYVDDDRTWELIKNGTYKMFSIEGRAIREPVTKEVAKSDSEVVAKTFGELVEKFNPYHDRLGRFTSGGGFGVSSSQYTGNQDTKAVTFSANPKTRAGALAIARHGGVVPAAYGDDYAPPKKVENPKAEKPKTKKPKVEKPKDEPQADENGFTPAKSKDEAVEYAKSKLGFESANYGKLDVDTINHVNKEITAIQKKYPELRESVKNIEIDNRQGVYAAAGASISGKSTLYIGNTQYGKGLEHVKDHYQKDVDSGFHPVGTDYKSVIWHEYGHMFAYTKCKTGMGFAANETLGYWDGVDYAKGIRSRNYEKGVLRDAAKSLKITQKEFKSRISRYAEKNPAETFAEAFAEFNTSANPRPECIALMKAAGILK